MTLIDDCNGFVVVAVVVDIVLADEAAAVPPHCELVVVLGFFVAAAYAVNFLDSRVVFEFLLALYLVVVAGLNVMLILFFWFFPFFKRC